MNRASGRTIAALAGAAIAVAAWQLWPTDARRIRRKLDAIAAVLNEQPTEGVAQLARTVQLANFITDDVVLEPGRGAPPIQGRERLVALARAQAGRGPFTVSFPQVSIDVAEAGRATAYVTARIATRDERTGEETVDERDVTLEFRCTDDWRIGRITVVRDLESSSP